MSELNTLVGLGAISWDTYGRASTKAMEDLIGVQKRLEEQTNQFGTGDARNLAGGTGSTSIFGASGLPSIDIAMQGAGAAISSLPGRLAALGRGGGGAPNQSAEGRRHAENKTLLEQIRDNTAQRGLVLS